MIQYTASERMSIWAGIEVLANDGRLRILDQVLEELGRKYPEVLPRLASLDDYRAPRTTNALRILFSQVIAECPDLLDEDSPYEQADGWLVASAVEYGYCVTTDELPSALRTSKRSKVHIPDACESLPGKIGCAKIRCRTLREIANDEGWLP